MQSEDVQVLQAAAAATRAGHRAWLATVVAVHGSSPRPPGSMALFLPPDSQIGSLSGGCVEEELAAAISAGEFSRVCTELSYGVSAEENARLGLPCGGYLQVLLQALSPDDSPWLAEVLQALESRANIRRVTHRDTGSTAVASVPKFHGLRWQGGILEQCFGPRQRLLLIGAGQLAASVADLAIGLEYDVLVCDPRDEARADWRGPNVTLMGGMPDDAVRAHADDPMSIVITLTHDPRIDDMALMEALESRAWYVGALGSKRTTEERLLRLRALGLPEDALARLHAPVGLDIGSKTPAEIAVSILAELTRLRRRGV